MSQQRINPMFNKHSELLDKKSLKKSSRKIKNLINDPKRYLEVTVDMLSLTIDTTPLTITDFKFIKRYLKQLAPELTCSREKLSGKYAKQAKFRYQFQIRNKNGYLLSIFTKSDINMEKRKANRKNDSSQQHELFHREVKISVNPNTFGKDNIKAVVSALKLLWKDDYLHLINRAFVTELDLAFDTRDLLIEHTLTKYSYRANFSSYFSETSSGYQYGKDCGKKFYNKSIENGGEYKGCKNYWRFESKYRPQKRNSSSTFRRAHKQCRYNFRGFTFYAPKILKYVTKEQYACILQSGFNDAVHMFDAASKEKLMKRIGKYELKFDDKNQSVLLKQSGAAIRAVQKLFDIRK